MGGQSDPGAIGKVEAGTEFVGAAISVDSNECPGPNVGGVLERDVERVGRGPSRWRADKGGRGGPGPGREAQCEPQATGPPVG